jgi:hypothetical protein
MTDSQLRTTLHDYVDLDEAFHSIYETYQPDIPTLALIHARFPHLHVVIFSRYTCPDCARNVPRMARIAEHLPGWDWEIFESTENRERLHTLSVTHVPTFIVCEQEGGRELGRIVENPVSGSLEMDLLRIAGL